MGEIGQNMALNPLIIAGNFRVIAFTICRCVCVCECVYVSVSVCRCA